MTEPPPGPPDALKASAYQLLRDWFHWFSTDPDAPVTLPDGLHVATAAYLAARAVRDGRKIYSPRDL
jgi:hypothetical protein